MYSIHPPLWLKNEYATSRQFKFVCFMRMRVTYQVTCFSTNQCTDRDFPRGWSDGAELN